MRSHSFRAKYKDKQRFGVTSGKRGHGLQSGTNDWRFAYQIFRFYKAGDDTDTLGRIMIFKRYGDSGRGPNDQNIIAIV